MDEQTRERFEKAVERKAEEARRRSQQHERSGPGGSPAGVDGDQHSLISDERGAQDPREKSSVKGKVTADKWNQ